VLLSQIEWLWVARPIPPSARSTFHTFHTKLISCISDIDSYRSLIPTPPLIEEFRLSRLLQDQLYTFHTKLISCFSVIDS
jgi:hypothetical protein